MTNAANLPGELFDVGIVGGGPAGLSAAIWSARYGHRVLLVDGGDPRNWESRGVNGYLGMPAVRPCELRGSGRDEVRTYGVSLVDAAVQRIDRNGEESFVFDIEGGVTARARRVLLAIGMRDVWPDIPGLAQVYGANAHVCPDCDGYDARDSKVVVIGHGRRAVAMALALTTWTSDIRIVTHGSPPDMDEDDLREKLQGASIDVLGDVVARVRQREQHITGLELASGVMLDVDKIFFTLAQYPADDLGVQLGCERDNGGHILVGDNFATSVQHVFAAGDITPGPQLAVRAAAGGAVAAMAIHKSLVPDDRKLR